MTTDEITMAGLASGFLLGAFLVHRHRSRFPKLTRRKAWLLLFPIDFPGLGIVAVFVATEFPHHWGAATIPATALLTAAFIVVGNVALFSILHQPSAG